MDKKDRKAHNIFSTSLSSVTHNKIHALTPSIFPQPLFFITEGTEVSDAILHAIAYIPTEFLLHLVEPKFFYKLENKDFMRIATFLARKSYYEENGCPIGAVIIDENRQIIGKGHNMLVQENDSTTHGETMALRDAGRVAKLKNKGPVDFRKTTLFTTLTPCVVCCAQINYRTHFKTVVIGDITNAPSTESILRASGEGVKDVVILEDPEAIALYKEYSDKHPDLNLLDWGGYKELSQAKL